MKESGLKAGVMGWPIKHSLSPRLHNYWLKARGIEGSYEALAVQPEKLAGALRDLPEQGFRGVNLTIPHKEAALKMVDHIEPLAARVGAINTIIVRPDKSLEGRNTDVYGFAQNLLAGGVDNIKNSTVTVLGAGGAARAVIVALQNMEAREIRVVNRTQKKADALRHELGGPIKVFSWEQQAEAMKDSLLLVNATALGLEQKDASPQVNLASLPVHAAVTDVVYAPLMTGLLKSAAARGHKIIDGLGMLFYQGQPAFEAWFGVRPEVTAALRAHMIEAS